MLLTPLQVKEHVCCGRCGTILPVVIMIIGMVMVYINVVQDIRMTGRKRMVLAASATNQAIMITELPLMNTLLNVHQTRALVQISIATPVQVTISFICRPGRARSMTLQVQPGRESQP